MYRLKKFTVFSTSLILLVSIFFLANISFAEEIEKGTKIILTKDQQALYSTGTNNVYNEPAILLRLGFTHFDPLQGLPPAKDGLDPIPSYDNDSLGYYIVQFDGPILNSWKNQLKETGAEIFDYVPDFAFIIRVSPDRKQEIQSFEHVRWIGIYQTSFRISQDALNKIYTADQSLTEDPQGSSQDILFHITVFPGENLERVKSAMKALDCAILEETTTSWKTSFNVEVPPNQIKQLPLISGIKWIEPAPEWELFNNIGTDIMDIRTPRDTNGLYGSGQTVGVCDTGLDQGATSPALLHDDFENGSGVTRVLQIIDVAGDGAASDVDGHGTHVAGSVLGNGKNSGSTPSTNTFPTNCFAGAAPKANLVFQACANNSTGGLELPGDLNTLFAQSNTAGADLHTNSWGSSQGSKYTSSSQDVDEYIWDNKDFFILFSAGNSGMDLDGDGVIDEYSLGSPATAKNCLSVGASENNRPTGAGYDIPWGSGSWAYGYSADPINSDHVSNDPTGMAAFSSRGPVLDGRYKPDIVAPGTNILSTRSSQASSNGWGAYDSSYLYMGGTSMSTPLTAGAAALMREYLIKKGHANPSAALIKAALLNSAENISPGQYGTGVYREIPAAPGPNNVTGWGRLNIKNGVYPAAPFNIKYFDEQTGLSTEAFKEYSVTVSAATSPLKINLAWSDYPGVPGAEGGLVNDLDLQITNPSSTVIYPDNASKKPTVSTLDYNDGNIDVAYSGKLAVRFTPSSYPAHLDAASFFVVNTDPPSTDDIKVVVYNNDNGGLPGGTILYTKTLTYGPTGWVRLGITGVVINSGDFFISVEHSGGTYLGQDNSDLINPGRSYYSQASSTNWVPDTGYASYIQATVRGADYSTQFDRVNNVLGLTLDNPVPGTYTIKVSGYNVPQGPQPYSLVVSGEVGGEVGTKVNLPFIPLLLLNN